MKKPFLPVLTLVLASSTASPPAQAATNNECMDMLYAIVAAGNADKSCGGSQKMLSIARRVKQECGASFNPDGLLSQAEAAVRDCKPNASSQGGGEIRSPNSSSVSRSHPIAKQGKKVEDRSVSNSDSQGGTPVNNRGIQCLVATRWDETVDDTEQTWTKHNLKFHNNCNADIQVAAFMKKGGVNDEHSTGEWNVAAGGDYEFNCTTGSRLNQDCGGYTGQYTARWAR